MGTHPRVGALSKIQKVPPEVLPFIREHMWKPITDGTTFVNRHEEA